MSTDELPREDTSRGGKRVADEDSPSTSAPGPKSAKVNEFRLEEVADGYMQLKSSNPKIDYLAQKELEVKI